MKHSAPLSLRAHVIGLTCLGLIFCEGILALLWIFSQPADPDSAFLFGFSPVRWGLAGVIFLLTGLAGALWLDLLRGAQRAWWQPIARRPDLPALLAGVSLGLMVFAQEVLLLLAAFDDSMLRAVFTRLLPVGVFLGLASLEILLAAAFCIQERSRPDPAITRSAGLVWAGLALAGGLVLLVRLEIEPASNGWYEYGVPLVHKQILDLFNGALLVLLVGLAVGKRLTSRRLGALVGEGFLILAIWVTAVVLWSHMPVPNSWFAPRPFPPNYEVYPNSDSLSYDVAAQGNLLGAAWARGDVHYKPLYVAFLTLLHAVAGQDYSRVIRLQTLVLALFPVSLYLLGYSLHSRLAGALAALAAILREVNQLTVGSLTTLSTSNLMLSELPTALGISALLLLLVIWLREPEQRDPIRRPYLALLAGGLIGLLIQVRLQTILFLPALLAFLFVLMVWPANDARTRSAGSAKGWRTWLIASGLVGLGFCLSSFPLVLRNWSASGILALEKPGYFERTLEYSYDPVVGETEPADQEPASWGRTVRLASRHFVHNTVSTFLVLPSGLGSGAGWTQITDLPRLFWVSNQPNLSLPAAVWMIFHLAMIALGAVELWRQSGWVGLLPAIFFATYNLSSSLGGFSGQRFILPVDWIGYFYFLVGLVWLSITLLGLLGWNAPERLPFCTRARSLKPTSGKAIRWKVASVAGLLLLAGGLLPLEEALVPVRYPGLSATQARSALLRLAEGQLSSQELSALRALLDQPGSELRHGVGLYPRVIDREEAEAGILRHTGKRTYPLLAYVYLGNDLAWVIQPLQRTDEITLPNGAEVLVAGTATDGSFRAFATANLDTGQVLLSSQVNK